MKRFRARRKSLKMSQRRLGAEVDMDEREIRRIEYGEASLRVIVLFEVVQALDMTLSEFFEEG